jgi:hypothetical protein
VVQRNQAIVRRRTKVAALRRRVAERRAEALLVEHLTPEQRDDWERMKTFRVIGSEGRVYRIRRGIAGNIERYEGERRVEQLCVHINGTYPVADNLLTQKLALEYDEADVRRTANIERLAG